MSIETGVLIKARNLGIPVIVTKYPHKNLVHNPLPPYGKEVIWEYARSTKEASKLINKFNSIYKNDRNTISKYARDYKDMFFSEPTEDMIIDTFDLNNNN